MDKKQIDKQKLREKIKLKLLDMTSIKRQLKDIRIYNKLIALKEFKDSKTIFTYVSWAEEVDTGKFINLALKEGKKVFVPKIDLKKKQMDIYQIKSLKELKEGTYKILEPTGEKSRKKDFDIIIIPGLAFDRKKNRLGRGGGYFDKFLKNAKGLKVALCFKEQIVSAIPVQKHDIKMNMLISA